MALLDDNAGAQRYDSDYLELRADIYAKLHREFSGRLDFEALYHDAWVELLEWERKGNPIVSRKAVLRKIVWQRAVDAKRRKHATPVEPDSMVLSERADTRATPDEAASVNLDRERLWGAIESLEPRQAAAIKLRFDCDMSSRDIGRHLGVSERRLEKIFTAAYERLRLQLDGAGGESKWDQRRRSVLLACELGIASGHQRRWAQKLVDRDPIARAQLRELRAALREAAVMLPMPVAVDPESRRQTLDVVFGRVADLVSGPRRAAQDVVLRDSGGSSQLFEHATTAGGTSLGAGAAAKIALACLAVGGSTAACVSSIGLLDRHPGDHTPRWAQIAPAPKQHVTTYAKRATPPPVPTTTAPKRTTKAKTASATTKKTTPVSSPKWHPQPAPAPVGSEEFGPGNLGSSGASTQPTAAPSDGGGEFLP